MAATLSISSLLKSAKTVAKEASTESTPESSPKVSSSTLENQSPAEPSSDSVTDCKSGIDVASDQTLADELLTDCRRGILPSETLERLVSDRYEGMWSQVMSSRLSTLR